MILFVLLFIVGLLVSMFGSIVGFGGGLFLVPILVVFFKFPMAMAVSTSLISLLPSAIISTIHNHLKKFVLYKLGILLEIPTVVGTVIGSLLVAALPVVFLKSIFVVFVVFLGISMLLKVDKDGSKSYRLLDKINRWRPTISVVIDKEESIIKRLSIWLISFFGLLAGFLSGLFGIGGGFLKTPIMIKVFKVPARKATATALFMIIITATVGATTHYLNGALHPGKALPVILGFMAGAFLAGFLHVKIHEKHIEKLVGMALILAGAAIVVNLVMG